MHCTSMLSLEATEVFKHCNIDIMTASDMAQTKAQGSGKPVFSLAELAARSLNESKSAPKKVISKLCIGCKTAV